MKGRSIFSLSLTINCNCILKRARILSNPESHQMPFIVTRKKTKRKGRTFFVQKLQLKCILKLSGYEICNAKNSELRVNNLFPLFEFKKFTIRV